MASITIVGLGPGALQSVTVGVVALLESVQEVYLRTTQHPVVRQLPTHLQLHSFDHLYETIPEFAALYHEIAREIVVLGERDEGVVYAVPGHPFVGETTIAHIVPMAKAAGIPVHIVDGLSFLEPSLAAVGADALDNLQIADATTFDTRYFPPFDADRPVLIAQVYNRQVASDTKLLLMEQYPDDFAVTLLHGLESGIVEPVTLPLHDLDKRDTFTVRTSLWVPPLPTRGALHRLQDIVAHLRAPDGCPWDREQDLRSLRSSIIEEAYEVVDAVDRDDTDGVREELGDQLLVVAMYAQMASEAGDFTLHDVINDVSTKLIRRHPHVWKDVEVSGSDEVLANWDAIKVQEKVDKGTAPKDVYDEVPLGFPSLMRAEKIAKRAKKQGWTPTDPAAAFATWQDAPDDPDALGDLFLALAVYANAQKQESETLVREAVNRMVAEMRGEAER